MMTFPDLTICFEDKEDREKYEVQLATVHWCINAQSERAKGTYDVEDTAHPLS